MEPAITSVLSSGVDLTLQHFQDIGWFGASPCIVTGVGDLPEPTGVALSMPRPNPTTRGAAVTFRLERPEYVRLTIVDVNGRLVRTVHEGLLPAGEHTRTWDGRTNGSLDAAAGFYLVSLRTSGGTATRRVVVQ
jgi:hypothetical protein